MAETKSPITEERLAALEARLVQVELALGIPGLSDQYHLMWQDPNIELESAVEPWKHLVARRHPWRRQLYIKGRNMTVRQLVGSIKANKFDDEQAAANYNLPLEAIQEALAYAEENAELLALEVAYERFLLAREGNPLALDLYLDDCADSNLLHALLVQAGHTVVRPRDAGTTGRPDNTHLNYAAQHRLVLITKNPEDFLLLHQGNPNHHGIFAIYQDNDVTRDMSDADVVVAIGNIEAAVPHGYPIAQEFHRLNDWR